MRKFQYGMALVLLKITLLFGITYSQNFSEPVLTFTADYLTEPDNFIVTGKDTVLFNDPANRETPLYVVDVKRNKLINRIRSGKGPGELGTMYKTVIQSSNHTISVFDRALLRLHLYKPNLHLIKTLNLQSGKQTFMQAGLLSQDVFFGIPARQNLLQIYQGGQPIPD